MTVRFSIVRSIAIRPEYPSRSARSVPVFFDVEYCVVMRSGRSPAAFAGSWSVVADEESLPATEIAVSEIDVIEPSAARRVSTV
ncbi:hypothetical protein QP157_06340 [Sphingomonas sp. LR61]|uniref:hypothetical protein n=1 Tax=Sphingomonas sp. LR61 TaxID=3050234 RepID=UPI002FDFEA58